LRWPLRRPEHSADHRHAEPGDVGDLLITHPDLHRRLPAAATYILMVLAPNTGAIRFYQRHGLEIERETDAVSHYKDTMSFVPPDTPPVPALIMR